MTRLGNFLIEGSWPVIWSMCGWDTVTILGALLTVALCDILKG